MKATNDNGSSKYTDCILEAIDHLRKRKARPDLHRICHMLERRHGIGVKDTEAQLERLVDAGAVVKVEYKGSTSYRNAAKWGQLGKRINVSGIIQNSNDVSRCLHDAILSAKTAKGQQLMSGVSLDAIHAGIVRHDARSKLCDRRTLFAALSREIKVSCGNVSQLANGNYVLKDDIKNGTPSSPRNVKRIAAAPDATRLSLVLAAAPTCPPLPDAAAAELPAKLMKKSCDFGGEDDDDDDGEPRCDYCLLTSECNRDGNPEELLVCKDCHAKAHPSCMDYSTNLAKRSRMSPWQCIDCKTCYVCQDPGDADAMLFCDACDKGYHMECHDPKIREKPTGKWVCRRCQQEEEEMMAVDNNETVTSGDETDERGHLVNGHHLADVPDSSKSTVDGTPGLLTPCDSPVPDTPPSKSPYDPAYNYGNCVSTRTMDDAGSLANVPDATEWTIDDVEKYFCSVGFPEQARAFRDQEIDGRSLLLMKRNDVLTGLSIRLGPALKIYNHVRRLQLKLLADPNNEC